MAPSRYQRFTRAEWAALRADTPLTLTEEDLTQLRGLNDRLSLDEVIDIYLPLSRLLNLHIGASQALHGTTAAFLGRKGSKAPYLIGLAGSVAVGKSTTARIMQALLARWPNHPKVDLVATDGFLHSRRVLDEHGIMHPRASQKAMTSALSLRSCRTSRPARPGLRCPSIPISRTTSCPASFRSSISRMS